jgi:hypothetical protein
MAPGAENAPCRPSVTGRSAAPSGSAAGTQPLCRRRQNRGPTRRLSPGSSAGTATSPNRATTRNNVGFHAIDRKDVDLSQRLLEYRPREDTGTCAGWWQSRAVRQRHTAKCISRFVAQGGHVDGSTANASGSAFSRVLAPRKVMAALRSWTTPGRTPRPPSRRPSARHALLKEMGEHRPRAGPCRA